MLVKWYYYSVVGKGPEKTKDEKKKKSKKKIAPSSFITLVSDLPTSTDRTGRNDNDLV